MGWQDEYSRKSVPASEAIKVIKSGNRVGIPLMEEPVALMEALFARRDELEDVEIVMGAATYATGWTEQHRSGWFEPEFGKSFKFTLELFVQPITRRIYTERRADFLPIPQGLRFKSEREGRGEIAPVDALLITVSPPDKNGYCSFGVGRWHKREYMQFSKTVLAEVDEEVIKTGGDNYIHVSEIDYFVPHQVNPRRGGGRPREVTRELRAIAANIRRLIRDGDTLQIGIGGATRYLPAAGLFEGKNDLGIHTEIIYPETLQAVRDGIITGKRKNVHKEKSIMAGAWVFKPEDVEFFAENPHFEIWNMEDICYIPYIAANDNMVAINNALQVDFSGQIASESIGPQIWTGAGGQTEFAIGAVHSRGGRSIIAMLSTAADGYISRIVPTLEAGTIVTVPRLFADYIVTEHGIARLFEKSNRERAEELINIAHPKFRDDLRAEAKKMLYP